MRAILATIGLVAMESAMLCAQAQSKAAAGPLDSARQELQALAIAPDALIKPAGGPAITLPSSPVPAGAGTLAPARTFAPELSPRGIRPTPARAEVGNLPTGWVNPPANLDGNGEEIAGASGRSSTSDAERAREGGDRGRRGRSTVGAPAAPSQIVSDARGVMPGANPLASYLAQWMSPADHALLVRGKSNAAFGGEYSPRSMSEIVGSTTGALAGPGFVNPQTGAAGASPDTAGVGAGLRHDPAGERSNPYLLALGSTAGSSAVLLPTPVPTSGARTWGAEFKAAGDAHFTGENIGPGAGSEVTPKRFAPEPPRDLKYLPQLKKF